MNNKLFTIEKMSALEEEIRPEGISLIIVRGFFASISRSKYRLKAMAALRAKIIQKIISKS